MVNSLIWHSSTISQRMLPIADLIQLILDNILIDGLFRDSIPHLTHLAFRDCPASSICLKSLTSPKLKALYLYDDSVEWNVLPNLNIFLSSFRGLETLAVRDIWSYEATREELRGVAGLANAIELHRDNLSFLLVHFNPMVHNNRHYDMPILRAISECIILTVFVSKTIGADLPGVYCEPASPSNAEVRLTTLPKFCQVMASKSFCWEKWIREDIRCGPRGTL